MKRIRFIIYGILLPVVFFFGLRQQQRLKVSDSLPLLNSSFEGLENRVHAEFFAVTRCLNVINARSSRALLLCVFHFISSAFFFIHLFLRIYIDCWRNEFIVFEYVQIYELKILAIQFNLCAAALLCCNERSDNAGQVEN